MRKSLLSLVFAGVACLGLSSCLAGPHQLKRTVDDWDQKMYVDSPWLSAALWVIPVFPICHFGAGIGDFLIGDAYAFWFKDAWDMKGTGFKHYATQPTDGQMSSLLNDDGSYLEIK